MNPPRIQLFSVEEYERRLQSVRDLMTQKTLDVILVHTPDNLYYLTGYQAPRDYCHQALILPIDSEPVFIAPPHEASLIPELCWVDDVRIYPDTSDWADVTSNLLKELGFSSGNIGLETKSRALTVDLRARISGQMPDAAMFDSSGLVELYQLIKSSEEQVFLRKAALFSELGMQVGIAAVREEATELDVTIAVHTALDLAGSEYRGHPSIIQSGDSLSSRYRKWSRKKIKSGELVYLEILGSSNGYHATFSRSVFVGDAPETVHRTGEIATTALEVTKSMMRSGMRASNVFETGRAVIGDATNIGSSHDQYCGIAHGIGIANPSVWGDENIFWINRDEQRPLRAGMSFHLIANRRIWGIGAIGSSDTVLITENGVETLTGAVPPGIKYLQ